MVFQPIAVIGRACVLPGALEPGELWAAVAEGRDLVKAAPKGRWRVLSRPLVTDREGSVIDRAHSDRGGYVEGFDEVFDPEGFSMPADEIRDLDRVFQWVLHCARGALRDAAYDSPSKAQRVGAVFGNLSFPSESMSRFAESIWLERRNRPDARNRFSSGLPALVLERALDLRAGALTLDAACASSLYAFKVACDWLHEDRADLVLAGAVNAADDLFIHIGFSALSALSSSGQSRPFHRDADGLVPAEGAGFLALKRLDRAEKDGDRILGVIRGIGLSNDGRGSGFLVPNSEGQTRAMRAAYRSAEIDPASISLMECHATGTRLGDATELQSVREVFSGRDQPLPIGSLKSNFGHLITAAGVGAAIKVLEAMKAGVRPPTLHADIPSAHLESEHFRLLRHAEPWTVDEATPDNPHRLRRASISAFGFGGNNAHMILEEYLGKRKLQSSANTGVATSSDETVAASKKPHDAIAIVGVGALIGECSNRREVVERLFGKSDHADDSVMMATRTKEIEIDITRLGIPPNDLKQTLAQQIAVLKVGLEAVEGISTLVRERTAAYVGMGVDAEVARYGARWRNAPKPGVQRNPVGDAIVPALESAGVIGAMPNIVTNRLNRALDLGGASCSVSAEERSGLEALELAVTALRRGEIDAAIVAAVDMSCEPVHEAALAACIGESAPRAADAAVAFVVKRQEDAVRDGDEIYALLEDGGRLEGHSGRSSSQRSDTFGLTFFDAQRVLFDESPQELAQRWGHPHAASGLWQLTVAALALRHKVLLGGEPWISDGQRSALVSVGAMEGSAGAKSQWCLLQADRTVEIADAGVDADADAEPIFHVFEGHDRKAVLEALIVNRRAIPWESEQHRAARLVIVARNAEIFERRRQRALAFLQNGAPPGEGVHFREACVEGELGFVFASAGTAYHGMGRELLWALPGLGDRLAGRFLGLNEALGWALSSHKTDAGPSASERLWGASALSQLHAQLSRDLWGLRPAAAIGYSSGESNSLFALGIWRDIDAMKKEIAESQLYERELGGEFNAVARAWNESGPIDWEVWSVLAAPDALRRAIDGLKRVYLAIIHSDRDCVVAGDAAECAQVVAEFGASRCRRLEYNLAAHVPEVNEFREPWLQIHRREVTRSEGIRFYSGGCDGSYIPDREACAQNILSQCNDTLDFPRIIENAWRDGVRVFVEHGPGGACSSWIREILGDRLPNAVVVSLDRRGQGIEQSLNAAAALIAAGVELDPRPFVAELRRNDRSSSRPVANAASKTQWRLPAHPPKISANEIDAINNVKPKDAMNADAAPLASPPKPAGQTMKPAPQLPPANPQFGDVLAVGSRNRPALHVQVPSNPPKAAATSIASITSTTLLSRSELASTVPHLDFAYVHRQFLQGQADVHRKFLNMRRRLQSLTMGSPSLVQPTPVIESPTLIEIPDRSIPMYPGPQLNRAQLEIHGNGKISKIYGALFERQDGFARQVRMPAGPLLLADRVTGIDAEPGVLGTGILWSETDVRDDSWHLNAGRMPAGILIESGQADLMLISYMGADFLNEGEKVYRLLGCRLTFEADLPRPGDTLKYEIHIDGHAQQDDIRLFFFHYDCHVDGKSQISVRDGQAGFFSDAELAASAGILWSPEEAEPCANPRLDIAAVDCTRDQFTQAQVQAFAERRPWECFGDTHDLCRTHTRSPAIQEGQMLFLDDVPAFDAQGGPWGRGYLRAQSDIAKDDWFFEGHFVGDPCMPGTLMFEGCLQALSFYITALGFTVERDGWRFQPVVGEEIDLRCRGQVTPNSKKITYEVFVEEVIAGPVPTVYADLLCTVDGLKAFHAKRVGLQLVPDWPLESAPELLDGYVESKAVATVPTLDKGAFKFDYASLLACAWGRPSDAFGPMYSRFDDVGRVPRLPGPPYHFLTRVVDVQGAIGGMEVGSSVEVEYDIPPEAWYFSENGARTMPFAVLLEAALQPCGWLASYIGSALSSDDELAFRNLDGTGTQKGELFEDAGTLSTRVKLTGLSRSAGMIIVNFAVECFLDERSVYELTTVFGFFPPASLAAQIGLTTSDSERAILGKSSDFFVDLRNRPDRYFMGSARLGDAKLSMLDQVDGFWPTGGEKGLGLLRAQRDIDVGDWYFKAHFFQDPVQPGSLGIEAMIQLLQFYMLETEMDKGIEFARFEPLALGHAMTWKYRGQVIPKNEHVQVVVEVTERGRDESGIYAVANASLWCDGIRIYSAENLGMRIVAGNSPNDLKDPSLGGTPSNVTTNASSQSNTIVLDPKTDIWLCDHRPTWQRPALPMMSVVDLLASAIGDRTVVEVRDVQLKGWVDFQGPRQFTTGVEERETDLYVVSLFADNEVEIATALVRTGTYETPPAALPRCKGANVESPYETGRLFHGPSFQLWKSGVVGAHGASALLDAGGGSVPANLLHPALLDAALHAIPHDDLCTWSDDIAPDRVAYPVRVCDLMLYEPMPTAGEVRVEIRFDGFLATPDLPRFKIQWIVANAVCAQMTLVETCFAKGPLGSAEPQHRREFLRDAKYVEGLGLSRRSDGITRLNQAEVDASDWMPGTVEAVYGTADLEAIAIKDHLTAREHLHPRLLPEALPLSRFRFEARRENNEIVVRDTVSTSQTDGHLDLSPLREFWDPLLGMPGSWLGKDLMEGLIHRYVRRVVLEDPRGFASLCGRGALFVGNHQVQIESILATHVLAGLSKTRLVTMANAKHESRWVGRLLRQLFTYPGCRDPQSIVYFDPKDPKAMLGIVGRLREHLSHGDRSFFVHCQGTRARSCREATNTISSLFLDLAIEENVPIVPIRFRGGLPIESIQGKLEFPVGHTRQDYHIGSAISTAELSDLPYADRRLRVLSAINSLSGSIDTEEPHSPDPVFDQAVRSWSEQKGTSEVEAVFYRILESTNDASELTRVLIRGAQQGRLITPDSDEGRWLKDFAGPLLDDLSAP